METALDNHTTALANTAPSPKNTLKVVDTEPKSRLAMMLLAFFISQTGLARVYRGEKSGCVRFWAYLASTVLMIVPLINLLAGLAMIVLVVWGIVDFYMLYNVKDDANDKALHETARDARVSKALLIVFTVYLFVIAAAVLLLIIGLSNGVMQNKFDFKMYQTDAGTNSTMYETRYK